MCQKNSCICGKGNSCPIAYPTYPGSLTGNNGWNPVYEEEQDNVNLDPDGQYRIVLKVVGWIGGQGTAPTDYVGQYMSTSGFQTLIANGNNIRGARGASGVDSTPWTEVTQADMTFINGLPTTETIAMNPASGTLAIVAITTGRIRYKQIQKTMILQYYFECSATILNGVETIIPRFYIQVPNSKIAVSVYDAGFYSMTIAGTTPADQIGNTNFYGLNQRYLYNNDLKGYANPGGSALTSFELNGTVIFETTT